MKASEHNRGRNVTPEMRVAVRLLVGTVCTVPKIRLHFWGLGRVRHRFLVSLVRDNRGDLIRSLY